MTELSHMFSHRVFSLSVLTHMFSHSHYLCSHRVIPHTQVISLTVFSLTLSQSVLSECSLTPTLLHTHVIPDTLSQSVLTHTLTHMFSHTTLIHTNSLILSQSVPTPTLLTHTCYPSCSLRVFSLYTLSHTLTPTGL